ncbi:MAG TPA: septal ring lytic transglycosylase RlpA family protein [Casimicrobiaceae bacterium]|jgi:rare lipoprotein A|nr:septal ring lytic transglycosylase RlpA family protein [Casimicrobiaceae bacterium]
MRVRKLTTLVASTILALAASTYAQALEPFSHARTNVAVKRVQHGKISWYGRDFAGRRTASGERFDPRAMTMAHRSLPLGTIVLVVNDDNGRSVALRVNDRGPFRPGRVADVSRAASRELGFQQSGLADATLRVLWMPSAQGGATSTM